MTQTSYAILTATGSSLLAQAVANNTTLNVTQIVIGQGTNVPTGNETALYDQIAVKDIADYGISESDASTLWFTVYLKAEEGPYAISEIGLLDKSGNLIAIGHLDPAIEKTVPASGLVIDMIIGLYLKVDKASAVTVTINEATSVTVSDMVTLPWLPVKSIILTAPPAAVENGDVYYVPAGATDAWEGMVGLLAQKTTGGWRSISPVEGHGISLPDGSVYQYVGGNYVAKLAPLTSPTFAGLVTVPPVTDFSQELALGAKSADTRYIGRASGNQDYSPLQGGINISSGEMWFSYVDGKGSIKYAFSQVAGDYVTTAQIQSDITIAEQFHFHTNGYFELYRQASDASSGILDLYSNYKSPNNNVFRITSDGTIHPLAGGGLSLDDPYANSGNTGDYNASPSISFGMSARGASATLRYEESVGRTNQLTLFMPSFSNNGGAGTYFWFDGPSGRINSSFGKFAFVSDLNAYQPAGDYATNTALNNGLAGKENAGVCVKVDTYVSDFSTSDSRIINLAYGHRIQAFTTSVGNNTTDGTWVPFPQAFSDVPVFCIAGANGNSDSVTDTDYWVYGQTASGCYVRPRNHIGNAFILAIGPK